MKGVLNHSPTFCSKLRVQTWTTITRSSGTQIEAGKLLLEISDVAEGLHETSIRDSGHGPTQPSPKSNKSQTNPLHSCPKCFGCVCCVLIYHKQAIRTPGPAARQQQQPFHTSTPSCEKFCVKTFSSDHVSTPFRGKGI